MRLLTCIICVLSCLSQSLAAPPAPGAPTSAPSSAPSSAPAVQTIAGGSIAFVPPPAAWTQAAKSTNGRTIGFIELRPVKATMAVNADRQEAPLDVTAATKIGQMLCKRIIDNTQQSNIEIIDPPKVEKDDRFFLRIHHRFRKGGNVGDQLQLYRVLGNELVAVAVTAYTDSPEQAKPVFGDAEAVTLSAHAASAAPGAHGPPTTSASTKPPQLASQALTLHEARIRLSPPDGWRADLTDAASGMVVTFHDPADNTNLLGVSVRQLPKEAKADPKLRDALLEEMASGEGAQFKIDGAEPVGKTVVVVDRRFLHKTRTRYHAQGRSFDISSRQVRAGDEIVSVTVVCLDDQFDVIDRLADQLALTVRAASR